MYVSAIFGLNFLRIETGPPLIVLPGRLVSSLFLASSFPFLNKRLYRSWYISPSATCIVAHRNGRGLGVYLGVSISDYSTHYSFRPMIIITAEIRVTRLRRLLAIFDGHLLGNKHTA